MQISTCAFNSLDHDGNPRHQEIYVKWKFPSSGMIKLNIDGSFLSDERKASYDGLFIKFFGNTFFTNAEI